MPAEASNGKQKRRANLEEYKMDTNHVREVEQKRSRGEVSCAECRRLKIKCDKQIPCQSCQRRGCAALCPNGSLSTGQGTRFVLAATEHLHRRVGKLGSRIRQLEDALCAVHAKHSDELHPLLREDLLSGANDFDWDDAEESMQVEEETDKGIDTAETINVFGTLSISGNGDSRFFGPTGGSESLLMTDFPERISPSTSSRAKSKSKSVSPPFSLRPQASAFSLFPLTPCSSNSSYSQHTPTTMPELLAQLPPFSTAHKLCTTYFSQVGWLFHGLTRCQLLNDMLPGFYPQEATKDPSLETCSDESPGTAYVGEPNYTGPHDLALLFSIFSLALLVETTSSLPCPPAKKERSNESKAAMYHAFSRSALALHPMLERPSLVTIQCLHIMSIYFGMRGPKKPRNSSSDPEESDEENEGEYSQEEDANNSGMEMTWSLISLAAQLSNTIGLHRDCARWGLSPKIVERRRILFWDLFVADIWHSLSTGRPPSFSLPYVDCQFPKNNDDPDDLGFESWGFRFAKTCVADVSARTLTAEAPSYSTIMELDRKVREFPIPDDLRPHEYDSGMGPGGNLTTNSKGSKGQSIPRDQLDMKISFQRCILGHIRETILLYIHRSFFAQAIIDHPTNPLKSVYAPSFLAAYRASTTVLKAIKEQMGLWPNTVPRMWPMMNFAFSSAVVFGTVVARGPRSPLAASAMIEFEQALVLFSKAATQSRHAARALPILRRLGEKARIALSQNTTVPRSRSWTGDAPKFKTEQGDPDDELAIFAGHTRVVAASIPRSKSTVTDSSPLSAEETSPPSFQTASPLFAAREYEYQPTQQKSSSSPSAGPYAVPWTNTPFATTHQQEPLQYSRDNPNIVLDVPHPRRMSIPVYEELPRSYEHWPLHRSDYNDVHMSSVQTYLAQNTNTFNMYQQQNQNQNQNHQQRQHVHPGLADLGIAARHSAHDQTWSELFVDEGLLVRR